MATILTAAEIALLAYVPGAVIFRLPWGDRARRAQLPAEERAFWSIVLSLSVSLAVALALAAAGKYTLTRVLAADAGVSMLAAVAARGSLRFGAAQRPSASALAPLVLVVVGCWLYFPTAEYVMGGKDPGVYVSEGIQIAQRGTLWIDDRLVASIPSSFRDLFFLQIPDRPYFGGRFMGFFLFDPTTGRVVGQFPHLFPASMAIAYDLAGLDAARAMVALWATLGLTAVYFVAARLIGSRGALLAALLLAVNVIQVWYGRYPNAEVALQALLMAALLATDRALVERSRFFEVVAGGLLGLLVFVRVDAVLALGSVALALALGSLGGLRLSVRFFAALAVAVGLAYWYLSGLLIGYSYYLPGLVSNLGPPGWALIAVLAVVALLAFASGPRLANLLGTRVDWVPTLLAAALILLAGYAYFLRHPEGALAAHDAYAFRTYAWYVTAPGLLAAVAGAALLVRRLFWRAPAFFSTAMALSVFFFYKIRIVPQHFWMTRRFLPIVLPATAIAIAGLAVAAADWKSGLVPWLGRQGWRRMRPLVAAVAVALVAALAAEFWQASAPVHRHVEYAGMVGHLGRILEKSTSDDLLLVEARAASDLHVLALPLAYIYGRNVLVLATREVDNDVLVGFVNWARQRYRNVYFLGRGRPLLSKQLGLIQVWSDVFWVPEYESPFNAYPSKVKLKEFRYEQCRLVVGEEAAASLAAPVVPLDDVHLSNFYEPERDERGAWRWSQGESDVLLTNVTAAARSVVIDMEDGGRPAEAPPAVVDVSLGGRSLGRVAVGRGMKSYTFGVPDDLAQALAASDKPATLRLAVAAWVPRQLLGTPDDRTLGVMVSRIEVSSAPWPLQSRPRS